MKMARFYSNENLPLAIVNSLRSVGHDVLTSLYTAPVSQP